jgi:hypothetical protein
MVMVTGSAHPALPRVRVAGLIDAEKSETITLTAYSRVKLLVWSLSLTA